MFDFGNANDGQRKAIAAADGPVLITAGPGTGKTYTLVQRAIYLIEECSVKPESIFIATFTEKAAKELVTRITNELANRNITANINEMYIGTFHSLCLRILKEHLEYTRLRRNYRLMDSFDQQYMVFQNIHRFRSIPEIEIVLPNGGAWKQAETICNFVNNLSEELVSPEELMSDRDPSIASLGRMLQEYRTILTEANLMDFSSIQIEAYRLLCDNKDILNELRSAITHIMVDEYQDTNYIQEQLVFLLAGERISAWSETMTKVCTVSAVRPSETFWSFRRSLPMANAVLSRWSSTIVPTATSSIFITDGWIPQTVRSLSSAGKISDMKNALNLMKNPRFTALQS